MIDTLKLSKGLQKAGMTEAQAEGITEALKEAQTDYVKTTEFYLQTGVVRAHIGSILYARWRNLEKST
jgi:hypothetical protein